MHRIILFNQLSAYRRAAAGHSKMSQIVHTSCIISPECCKTPSPPFSTIGPPITAAVSELVVSAVTSMLPSVIRKPFHTNQSCELYWFLPVQGSMRRLFAPECLFQVLHTRVHHGIFQRECSCFCIKIRQSLTHARAFPFFQ
jgi:hypothetical protein